MSEDDKGNTTESVESLIKGMQEESIEKLKSVRKILEGEAKIKTERARLHLKGTKYELSDTFFEPTGASVDMGSGTTAFQAWKAQGIKRPYATSLITKNTIKLYRHESGIITSLENRGNKLKQKLRLVTRLPVEVPNLLSVKTLSKDFPSIEMGLFLKKEGIKTDELEVYFDGDLNFKRSMPWRFERENMRSELEPWERELPVYKDFLRRTILETSSAVRKVSDRFTGEAKRRYPQEVIDFTKTGNVDPRYSFYGSVVNGLFDQNTQILSRVLQSDAEKEDGVDYEIRIQLPVVRNVGYQLLAKDLAVITGSPFPQFEANSPELLQIASRSYAGWGHDNVDAVGDVVYDRHATSKGDLQQSKDVVNRIGKEFLRVKLEHECDF